MTFYLNNRFYYLCFCNAQNIITNIHFFFKSAEHQPIRSGENGVGSCICDDHEVHHLGLAAVLTYVDWSVLLRC